MLTFSGSDMHDEIEMIRRLQDEGRRVPEEQWVEWVNTNKDKIRFFGNDGYVPDREEWVKRCEYFLACMGVAASRR